MDKQKVLDELNKGKDLLQESTQWKAPLWLFILALLPWVGLLGWLVVKVLR